MESDATLESAFQQELRRRAKMYYQQAYGRQAQGALEEAIGLYQQSLALYPTAEAHTFLGWAYSFIGRYDDAIAECERAIAVDPEFGNPYNDIGAYLIELDRPTEAIEHLQRALVAKRYDCYHYAHFNLGRVYEASGDLARAREHFVQALVLAPGYHPAERALQAVERRIGRPDPREA
ncbi:MAG: tetratricopeptide repeat protein [Candidatus Sericytochromatia bacterium]|nr:tetratricopeptide repeat protein [Candidatus Sericytochromatia bacterium]